MPRDILQSSITKTAPFNSATNLDISAAGAPVEWKLNITDMGPDTAVTFQLQLSTDTPTPFATTTIEVASYTFKGPHTKDAPFSPMPKHEYDMPLLMKHIGAANAHLRLALVNIEGTSPTVTYESTFLHGV